MTHTTYDIFELAKDLKKAGVNDDAINAQVKFEKAKDENFNNTLATKKDLEMNYHKTIISLGIINVATIGIATAIIGFLIK